MGYRKVALVDGEYYHVYNRGNSKQDIFLDDEDRDRFVKLLYLCNSEKSVNFRDDIVEKEIDAWDFDRGAPIVSLGAWVLMSNHFHLYITSVSLPNLPKDRPLGDWGEKQNTENAVTKFMRKLSTGYSSYFNKKYDRTGSLFEGRFRSVHVSDDVQAKYLFSYIHLNPVKLIDTEWKEVGIKNVHHAMEFLKEYMWSSYHDHLGIIRKENAIVNLQNFPRYFSDKEVFSNEIFEWIHSPKDGPLGSSFGE